MTMFYGLCVGILLGLGTLLPLVRPCSMYVGMLFGLSTAMCFVC